MRAMKWIGLIGLVLCTGCAGLGKYAKDRGNDFLDCFTAQGGFGCPLPAFELHATRWVTTGAGFVFMGDKWGIDGRKVVTRSYEQVGFLGILPISGNWGSAFENDGALKDFYTYYSCVTEGQQSWFHRCEGVRVAKSIVLFDVTSIPKFAYHYNVSPGGLQLNLGGPPRGGGGPSLEWEQRSAIEALDVHVDVTLALVFGPSFRLGFSPGQFADFVLGLFGLDIAGDDAKPQPPKTTEGDKR